MKLFIASTILVLVQIHFLKYSLASDSKESGSLKMLELYDEKMKPVDTTFVEQCKKLCENCLKDNKIQEAATPLIKEFKQNITHYLDIYPMYEHYYLYNELLTVISDMILQYGIEEISEDNEFQYIADLLKKHGFKDINDQYDMAFELFMNSTILKEFEIFASELQRKERDLRYGFLVWLHNLKVCQDYDCYLQSYTDLSEMLSTPKTNLFVSIYDKYDKISMQYAANISEMLKSILNDSDLMKFDANLRENFTNDCNDYFGKYQSNTDESNLYFIIQIFNNIIQNYYNNTEDISQKDHELLKGLFVKHKYVELQMENQQNFKDFIEIYLKELFENHKNSLNEEISENDKSLLEWYDNIKQLESHEERINEFHNLYDFEED